MKSVFKKAFPCEKSYLTNFRDSLFVNWLHCFITKKELFFQLKIWTLISAESKGDSVNGQAAIRR